MDFLPDVIGGDEPEEVVIQEAVKPKLTEEGVFDDDTRGEPMKMKEVVQPVEEPIVEEPIVEKVVEKVVEEPAPQPVKKVRKKRVMTEEQKQKLAEARKKALVVRRANAKKKQEIKDLKKMKQDQELDSLRNSVIGNKIAGNVEINRSLPAPVEPKPAKPKPKPPPEPTPVQTKQYKYTEEDLQTFSLKAIQDYDTLRKSRKIEKQKQKQEESYKEKERQKLLRVVSSKPSYNSSDDYWGNCF